MGEVTDIYGDAVTVWVSQDDPSPMVGSISMFPPSKATLEELTTALTVKQLGALRMKPPLPGNPAYRMPVKYNKRGLFELWFFVDRTKVSGGSPNPWEAENNSRMSWDRLIDLINKYKVDVEMTEKQRRRAVEPTYLERMPTRTEKDTAILSEVFNHPCGSWTGADYAVINCKSHIDPVEGRRLWEKYGDTHGVRVDNCLYLANPDAIFWERIIKEQLHRIGRDKCRLIYGPAGSGKTYRLHGVIRDGNWDQIAACAPTGVACENLRKALKEWANLVNTPHTRFTMSDSNHKQKGLPKWFDKWKPLKTHLKSIYIAEEAFFWDTRTLALFLMQCRTGATVYFVGDPYQLPPVGWGSPVRALLDAGWFRPQNVDKLTFRHRTRKGSEGIDEASDLILAGQWPANVSRGYSERRVSNADLNKVVVDLMKANYQVVTPTNGLARWFGREFAMWNHQTNKNDGRKVDTDLLFLNRGDRCRLLVSNKAAGVYNGQAVSYWGYHPTNGYHEVVLDDGTHYKVYIPEAMKDKIKAHVAWEKGNYRRLIEDGWNDEDFDRCIENFQAGSCQGVLMHYEACTVHRAQGSEWERVAVVIPWANRLLYREWFYVAMTRARADVIVIFSDVPEEEAAVKAAILKPIPKRPALLLSNILDSGAAAI
jgi:hypothetical protein